jgi:hypothetical protein
MSVDRISTQRKTFDEIRSLIAGPVGTYVSLSFQGSDGAYECEKLLRGNVIDSIPWSAHVSLSTMPAAASSSALPSYDLFGTNEVRQVGGDLPSQLESIGLLVCIPTSSALDFGILYELNIYC